MKMLLAILLLASGLFAGCAPEAPAQLPPSATKDNGTVAIPGNGSAETMQVTVYFATKDAKNLVPEVRSVPKTVHPAQAAVELLLGEPKNRELTKVLPEGTKLRYQLPSKIILPMRIFLIS